MKQQQSTLLFGRLNIGCLMLLSLVLVTVLAFNDSDFRSMQLVEPNITLLITNTTSTEEIFAANNTKNSSIELDKSTPKYDLQYTINKTMDGKIHCNLTNTALFYDDDEISTTDASSDIKWYHNGHEVDFDHRYVLDPYTEELNIISARVEDEGIWHCGDKTTGDVGQSVSLVVLEEPKKPFLMMNGRRLDVGNRFISITEKLKLQVTCVAESGNPPPQIDWLLLPSSNYNATLRPDLPSLELVSNITFTYPSPATYSEATLYPVTPFHHNFTIVCIVSHVTLPVPFNTSFLLDVKYEPMFTMVRRPPFGYPVPEGSPFSLICEADGNPPVVPYWVKNNDPPQFEQKSSVYWNISVATLEDQGWYKCAAKYQSRVTSSMAVYLIVAGKNSERLKIGDFLFYHEEVKSSVEIILSGEVQLECPSNLNSCWAHDVRKFNNLDIMDDLVFQDGGEYKCVIGTTPLRRTKLRSRMIEIDVFGAPSVYPKMLDILIETGEHLTFSLEFCSNPNASKIFWVHESRSFAPGTVLDDLIAHNTTETKRINCQRAELTIPTVKISHAGEYTLIVASDKGISGGMIVLNVTDTNKNSSGTANITGTYRLLTLPLLLLAANELIRF